MTRFISNESRSTNIPSDGGPLHAVMCDRCGEKEIVRMESDLPVDWGALVEHETQIVHYCGPCMEERLKPRCRRHRSPLERYFRSDKIGTVSSPRVGRRRVAKGWCRNPRFPCHQDRSRQRSSSPALKAAAPP